MGYVYVPDVKTPEQIEREARREAEAARVAYQQGYEIGQTLYRDDPDALAYGINYYEPRSRWKHGAYEKGIYEALIDRADRTQEEQS